MLLEEEDFPLNLPCIPEFLSFVALEAVIRKQQGRVPPDSEVGRRDLGNMVVRRIDDEAAAHRRFSEAEVLFTRDAGLTLMRCDVCRCLGCDGLPLVRRDPGAGSRLSPHLRLRIRKDMPSLQRLTDAGYRMTKCGAPLRRRHRE
jgi:hypothetical protein